MYIVASMRCIGAILDFLVTYFSVESYSTIASMYQRCHNDMLYMLCFSYIFSVESYSNIASMDKRDQIKKTIKRKGNPSIQWQINERGPWSHLSGCKMGNNLSNITQFDFSWLNLICHIDMYVCMWASFDY